MKELKNYDADFFSFKAYYEIIKDALNKLDEVLKPAKEVEFEADFDLTEH